MRFLLRLLYAALAIGAVIANFSISGLILANINHLKALAYPTYFGAYMLLSGLVFTVLAPVQGKRFITIPWLQRFLAVDDKKFESGIWSRLRRRGPFTLVLASAVLLGPFFAALVIRFLGLNEHKAWLWSFVTTLMATAVWVSIYLGAFGLLRSLFASLVS
jgi:hypothetical protein